MGVAGDLDELLTAVGTDRDSEAFALLFDHFVPRVQAQMMRLGLAPFAAADVTQDVMETIWRKAHLFDPRKAAAATWVFHIARNRRIDVRRRSRETICAIEDFFDIPDPANGSDDCIDCTQREAVSAPGIAPFAARAIRAGQARLLSTACRMRRSRSAWSCRSAR